MKNNKRSFYAHPLALIDKGANIGAGTKVWGFTHIQKGVKIGKNCNIGEHCYIEEGVIIGDNVVIKNGVNLWNGLRVEDLVFIGPSAVFTNDIVPRSKVFRKIIPTKICEGASIGANATILCGITIGRYALVGAGAVVTKDLPAHALIYGNPATIRGYVCKCGNKIEFSKKSLYVSSKEAKITQCPICKSRYVIKEKKVLLLE